MLEIHKSHQNRNKMLYFVEKIWKFIVSLKSKFSLSGIPVVILSTYWKSYFISNALLYVVVVCWKLDTHIYFHSLHGEDLDWRRLVGHEPVELVAALVPLDAVEVVTVQVVAAHQVGAVPRLNIPGDPQVDLAQAGQFWNSSECWLGWNIFWQGCWLLVGIWYYLKTFQQIRFLLHNFLILFPVYLGLVMNHSL